MGQKKTILLVDDHKIIRDGIRFILEQKEDFTVLDCSSGKEALHMITGNKVDLIISDINMQNMSGMELCEQIKTNWPDLKILILSMNNDSSIIKDMLDMGANGYLVKDSGREEIQAAIDAILNDEYYFSKEAALAMAMRHTRKNTDPDIIKLTEREKEILTLIAREYTNKEIGETLFISTRTVDSHRRNLIEKIGARNTAGLVKYAITNNLALEY